MKNSNPLEDSGRRAFAVTPLKHRIQGAPRAQLGDDKVETNDDVPEAAPGTGETSVKTPVDWLAKINEVCERGRSHNLELARVVYAAKCELRFGQWSKLWHSDKVMKPPFSKRKGEFLVVIGKGLGDLDANSCSHLPSACRALYYLAQLDRAVLLNLITQGVVRRTLTITEAKALLGLSKGKSKANPGQVSIKRHFSKFEAFFRKNLRDWTPRERELARRLLLELAREIANQGNTAETPLDSTEH